MSCDVCEVKERLENEHASPTSQGLHLIVYTWRAAHGSFMLPVISVTSSLFSVFFSRETIKYEINKYYSNLSF